MYQARCHEPDFGWECVRTTTNERPHFHTRYSADHAYINAHCSKKHQQEVHAMVVLPELVWDVLTDLTGGLSGYNRQRNSLMTFATRARRGYIDHIWQNGRPDEARCVADATDGKADTFEVMVAACVDAWLEVVRRGYCKHPKDFDGFIILPCDWGEELTYERTTAFDAKRSALPLVASFTPMPPPGREDLTLQQKIDYAEQKLAEAVEGLRKPRTKRAKSAPCRPTSRPDFRGDTTAIGKAEAEYRLWLTFYEQCRDTFRIDPQVVFAVGTVRFRELGAICDPHPVRRCL